MKFLSVIALLTASILTLASAQLEPIVADQAKSTNAGGGTFTASPNYVGSASDSSFAVIQGSSFNPSTTQGPAMVVSKTGYSKAFNAFAATAFKRSSLPRARATAIYGEATDTVGGNLSFIEGARLQATLRSGQHGAAYGAVIVAGTASAPKGPVTPSYLIGVESEVDDQIGPDAPSFRYFDKNNFTASYVATNGNGGGTRYKVDAAFVTNPYSIKPYRTGLLLTEGSIDDTGIGFRSGLSVVNGIDMSAATISGSAFKSPGFKIDGSGNATLKAVQLSAFRVATLPNCGAGATGALAFVVDAKAPGYNAPLSGGGSTRTLALCNGTRWTAH